MKKVRRPAMAVQMITAKERKENLIKILSWTEKKYS